MAKYFRFSRDIAIQTVDEMEIVEQGRKTMKVPWPVLAISTGNLGQWDFVFLFKMCIFKTLRSAVEMGAN